MLLVATDADDAPWQLIATSDAGPDGKIGHLWYALDEDHTLIEVANLEPGECAVRERVGGRWKRQRDVAGSSWRRCRGARSRSRRRG